MRPVPFEEWPQLSGALLGRCATLETMLPNGDAELIVADAPFDGLRLEGAGADAHILALAGGRVVWSVVGPARISRGDGDTFVIEGAGAPALRIVFTPELRPQRSPARERAVGERVPC